MKKLIIAEKPSVAKDLVKVLGDFEKKEDYFENEHYVVTSALGHLVELYMPEDIDPKYKRWSLESLPIVPNDFGLKVIGETKKKFAEIKKLLHRKDVVSVINACDAGREGELIFFYICKLAGNEKPFQRLWLSSMTTEAIKEGFQRLRPSEEMKALQLAAQCRSEADWIVGINGTRALTTRIANRAQRVISVGRVQTPTLAMIVNREREIRHFKTRDFWRIIGHFHLHEGDYKGVFQRKGFKKNPVDVHDRIDRLWDFAEVQQLLDTMRTQQQVQIEEKKKRVTQNAPKLYDLTLLQREANMRFHMPAGMTLKIAQSLYEKYKCTTYPRTDSQALPEDYVETCKKVLASLPEAYGELAEKVLKHYAPSKRNKRVFNNQQVRDHFAIIPTGKVPPELSEEERKIYQMIVRRFLAVFFPAAEFDVTLRSTFIGDYEFKTEGKVLVSPGWLEVYGRDQENPEDETLIGLHPEDGHPSAAEIVTLEPLKEATKPPSRYNEATLLGMMESAGKIVEDEDLAEAMKDRGLGTPATRAQIIEHLIEYRYMERDKKELIPTAKAEDLFSFLEKIDTGTLASPSMTGEWEFKLRQIENSQLSREDFMQGISNMTYQMVSNIRQFQENDSHADLSELVSPTDQKPMLELLQSYKSQDGHLVLQKTIAGRRISFGEYQQLLKARKTPLLEGFYAKSGKTFSAVLLLDENWNVCFGFDEKRSSGESSAKIESLEELEKYPVIGHCSLHDKPNRVFETETAFICERFSRKNKDLCHFNIRKTMLGITLSSEEVQKLLTEKKTGMIEGFLSKRTGRAFTAALFLKPDGNIGFTFPERSRPLEESHEK